MDAASRPSVAFSVSLIAGDGAEGLAATLRSVLNEPDVVDVFVVTSGAADALGGAGITDARVRVLGHGERSADEHGLLSAARESSAPLVAGLRAGDLLVPGALASLIEAAGASPNAGFVQGDAFEIDSRGWIAREAFRERWRELRVSPAGRRRTQDASIVDGSGIEPFRLYRRDAVVAVGGLAGRRAGAPERDLAWRMARRFAVRLVPAFVCARQRCRPGASLRAVRSAVDRVRRRVRQALRRARWWTVLCVRGAVEGVYERLVPRLAGWRLPAPRARARPAAGMRRVAYYTWKFPTLSETFVHRELAALARAGVPAMVLAESSEDPGRVDSDAVALLARTEYLPADRRQILRHHLRMAATRPLRYLRLFVYVLSRRYGSIKSLREDLTVFSRCVHVAGVLDGRIDHLHAPWADRSAFVCTVASRLLGVTCSVHARAHDLHRTTYRTGLEDRLAPAEFVVTNSRYNVEHVSGLLPRDRQPPLFLVYNGVEPSRFVPAAGRAPSDDRVRLLSVARLIEQKGLDHLLRACRILADRGQPFECDIVGEAESPLYTYCHLELRQLHRALGLEGRVRFLGALPLARVLDCYRRADVFVLPCVVAADGSRDIIPNAVIEAMAMRLPVVSTTVTGLPEIVEDGVSGLLVPPGDADRLADALQRLILDAALRERLGERARGVVERRFDVDANMARYARLFRGDVENTERMPDSAEWADAVPGRRSGDVSAGGRSRRDRAAPCSATEGALS